MSKIGQKIILEGSYQKLGSKIIHNTQTGLIFNILKRKQATLLKPPYYLFTNTLGKNGYISSMYPLGGTFEQSPDTTGEVKYSIEYNGVCYQMEVKETEVLITKNNLTS